MDFHQLNIFSHVYRYMSFTKASEKLHISQPTISEHLKNLETEFSGRLFDRLGRSIAPTEKADRLYPKVLNLLDDLEKLRKDFIAEEGVVAGKLVVGASTIPGTYLLPKYACRFRRQYPDTSYEIKISDTRQVTDWVVNHELLCGIVGARMKAPLNYFPLFEDELVFVAEPSVVTADRLRPSDLLKLPLIIREQGSGTRDNMINFLSKAGVELDSLDIVATLGSSASIKEAVRSGLGVSCLSRLAVKDELDRGEFVEFSVAGVRTKRNFYLVTHQKRTLPNHYQAFIDYLRHGAMVEI